MKTIFIFFASIVFFSCSNTSMMKLTDEEQLYFSSAMKNPTTFKVSQEDGPAAWGRAQNWIEKYSRTKLEVITDSILQTRNPVGDGVNLGPVNFGYHISRTDLVDSLEIKVVCLTDNIFNDKDRERNEHLLAYYIKTGIEPPATIIAK